ncbi:MAG: hypothetical protein ABEH83_14205 [Halobacterium sp.]
MRRHGTHDLESLAKRGTAASFALFAVGALGLAVAADSLPAWERTLLFDAELVGVLGVLLCPLVFGFLLPLTE